MSIVWKICFLFNYLYLIQCKIPTLNVWNVDRKVIEKKRQDTFELCKLFNEDNSILQKAAQAKLKAAQANHKAAQANQKAAEANQKAAQANQKRNRHVRRRFKREVKNPFDNPALNTDDVNKIENIVDKLYDDIAANGDQINYRRRNTENVTRTKNLKNRRFDFAPALLLGPNEVQNSLKLSPLEPTSVKIPWIKKWKYGIIPFFIDPNTYDTYLAETIVKAFDYIEKLTCIRLQRLREKPTDKQSLEKVEWLYISNPSGIKQCVHSNDQKPNRGVQMVVLGYDCLSQGEIAHEVLHVLGFGHEHTRPQRDQYITIHWENIKPGYKKYFEIRENDPIENMPYDYSSVLHYPPRAFSKNGQITISVKSGIRIGQRDGLSEIDVEKVGSIFGQECTERNKDYLLKTCPSVIKSNNPDIFEDPEEIEKYFKNRVWPYGIINFKIRDNMEFSIEERENIRAVLKHIEKETCIQFNDVSDEEDENLENDELKQDEVHITEATETPVKATATATDATVSAETTEVTEAAEVTATTEATETTAVNEIENDTRKLTYTVKEDFTSKLNILENEIEPDDSDEKLQDLRKKLNPAGKPLKALKKNDTKPNIRQQNKINKAERRHAENVLVLKRSANPGCDCPKPGKPDGNKALVINADCFNSVNDLLHFFVHVLGLEHQHNMHDRDSFLHIVWDKLTPELKEEMQTKLPPAASVGFAYDYQSVMHYPWLQIKDGVTSMMYPIWNDGWAMGHWQGLSSTDVKKLNTIYVKECQKRRNKED